MMQLLSAIHGSGLGTGRKHNRLSFDLYRRVSFSNRAGSAHCGSGRERGPFRCPLSGGCVLCLFFQTRLRCIS